MGTEEQALLLSRSEMLEARFTIQHFHRHIGEAFIVTSERDESYNCIAWAAGDNERTWWPSDVDYWPELAERSHTVNAFAGVFQKLGYSDCSHGELETGFEKVALFAKDARPQHMARQLPSGRWTSKTGVLHDIALGDLSSLSGGAFGKIVFYMKRKLM